MATRYYVCIVSGTGTFTDSFRPRLADLIPGTAWAAADGRADPTGAAQYLLAWADVTPAQHAILIADAGITYIPFEDGSGNVLGLVNTVGDLAAANRTAINTALENRNIPTDDFTLATTLQAVLARVLKRFNLRALLAANDYTTGLDTTISSLSPAQRQAINNRLTGLGFDTSVIKNSDTIRAALKKLFVQAVPYMLTHLG